MPQPPTIYPDHVSSPARTLEWRPGWPLPMRQVVSILRRGGGDPTFRYDDDGTLWRGIRTPEGTATLRLRQTTDGAVHVAAWGDGADWALGSVPAMLGDGDDPTGFVAHHPVVADLHRRHAHWRITRTGLVLEALVPAIIEQKVTGQEAFAGFRMLVHRFGERAPGPGVERRLWVQPSPETLRSIPSWEWLRMHIDPARSRAVVTAARVASSAPHPRTSSSHRGERNSDSARCVRAPPERPGFRLRSSHSSRPSPPPSTTSVHGSTAIRGL